MVIRGPFVHPGAVAVEDEFGRVVSLAHTSKRVSMMVAYVETLCWDNHLPFACCSCLCTVPILQWRPLEQVGCKPRWPHC